MDVGASAIGGAGEPARLLRLFWRLSGTAAPIGRMGTGEEKEETPAMETAEEPALAVRLRALAVEEVRWWRGGW